MKNKSFYQQWEIFHITRKTMLNYQKKEYFIIKAKPS